MEIRNYLNKENKIKAWPSKRKDKLDVLHYLGTKFETGRFYAEKEINRIIDEHHAFGDYFLLRRELVDHGILERTANGAKYWRGGLWPRGTGAETERLLVRRAAEDDAGGIADVFYGCGYMSKWTGQPHDEEGLKTLLEGNDLPPGGSLEFSHLAVACGKADGRMLGFAQYYTAWPESNCLWIGLLLMHPDFQRNGYGGEFVAAFIDECRRQHYPRIGLGVALRNQPALKFWVSKGFDRITKVNLDGETSAESLGVLGLRMDL